jgi:hypothetical protein
MISWLHRLKGTSKNSRLSQFVTGRLPQKAQTHPRKINSENDRRAAAPVEPTTKSSLFEVPLSLAARASPRSSAAVRKIAARQVG